MSLSFTLSKIAYTRIREMVQDGRISPGIKISETRLAKELGISRTPVREAIRQLQLEGLMYQVPQSGTYVSRPGRREIAEIYDVRVALELQAVTKAVPRLSHEQLEEISQLYLTMYQHYNEFCESGKKVLLGEKLKSFLTADMDFHLVIFKAADNQTAIKIYTDVQIRTRAFGDHSHFRDQNHLKQVLTSHHKILQSLQQEDVVAARQAMQEHIENSLKDALVQFDRMPEAPR